MNINVLNSVFGWLGIIAAIVTVISMLGLWYTGNRIERSKNNEIQILKQDVEHNKETYFTHDPKKDYSIEKLDAGGFKLSFILHPVGQKQVSRMNIKVELDEQTRFKKSVLPVKILNFYGNIMTGKDIGAHKFEASYDSIPPTIQTVTAIVDQIPKTVIFDWSAKE